MQASPKVFEHPPGLMTDLADRAVLLNWRKVLLIWIGCVQGLYALSLMIPSTGRAIPDLIQRDFGVSPFLFVLLFLYGIGHYLRGLRPRYSLVTSLVGQGLYTLAAAYYAGQGQASITILASHGGTFVVCFLAIAAIAQDATYTCPTIRFHHMLMPAMSLALALYAVGIGLQPDRQVAGWIGTNIGPLPLSILNGWLALGSGYIFYNHIKASGLYLALVSHYLYTAAAIAFFLTVPGVPVVAIGSHVMFAITSGIVILIQTQERQ